MKELTLILFSSLSESGFIPTIGMRQYTLKITKGVLISFREWLHSYTNYDYDEDEYDVNCSHLFQRVASFLHMGAFIF